MWLCRIILACLPICLHAQQAEEDTVAYSLYLEDFVITAQYEPTHLSKALYSVDVIPSKEIIQRGLNSLDQALQLSAEVRLYYDPILGMSVRMRGISASNVAILQDGVPVIGRQGGAIDISQISLQNVERIEIVKGALSNRYGNNAAGGVINIVTKSSQINPWSLTARSQLESIGQSDHSVNIGHQYGPITAQIHGRYFSFRQAVDDSLRQKNKYPYNPKTQTSIGGMLRYTYRPEGHILFKYDLNMEDLSVLGNVRRPQFKPYGNDNFFNTTRSDYNLSWKQNTNEWHHELITSHKSYTRRSESQRYYLETKEFDPNLGSIDTVQFSLSYLNYHLVNTSIDNWVLEGGVNVTYEAGEGDRIVDQATDQPRASLYESAIYTDIKYQGIKDLELSTSGRYTYNNLYKGNFTLSLKYKYQPTKKLILRGGYSQGFRSPALKELYIEFIDINHYIVGNPELQPERSHTLQQDLQYDPAEGLSISLDAYSTWIEQKISLVAFETGKFNYDNVDRYDVYGFTPAIDFSKGPFSITGSASISYWSTNINNDEAPSHGNVFDYNATASYDLKSLGFGLLINYRHNGKQPIYRLVDNEVKVGQINSFSLMDAAISKSLWKDKIKVNLGVKNLLNTLDTDIIGTVGGGGHSGSTRNLVSPGRSYYVNVVLSI